jgi:dUTP pyrophosphatase
MKLDWIPGNIFKQRKEEEKEVAVEFEDVNSNIVPVKIEMLHPDAIIPTYAHSDDACCDLYVIENYLIPRRQRRLLRTGIAIEIPTGYEVQLRPRSGLAWKHGVTLVNTPATVDAQYRNELRLIVINLGHRPITFKKGDRAAQMCIKPVYHMEFTKVAKLNDSIRGLGGFGSTGR